MIIKFEYDSKSWAYDDDDLTVLQGIAVEEHVKGTLMDYDEGLASGRSVCYQALGWLIFHDADPDVEIAGVDFPLVKLSAAWLEARLAVIGEAQAAAEAAKEAAEAAQAKPDPTAAPGSGAPSGNTSGHSRKPSATSPRTSTHSASGNSTT